MLEQMLIKESEIAAEPCFNYKADFPDQRQFCFAAGLVRFASTTSPSKRLTVRLCLLSERFKLRQGEMA